MANSFGPFGISTTGTAKNYNIGISPTNLRFKVGAKNGSSNSILNMTTGSVDSTGYQGALVKVYDNTNNKVKDTDFNDRCISVWEYSGSWTEVGRANFNSYSANGFKLDVITATSNYSFTVEADTA